MLRGCGAWDRETPCDARPLPTRQEARVSDNQIHDNISDIGGGGIRFCYFYGTLPRPACARNVISGNTSAEGGGVLCYEADSLELSGCVIDHNTATIRGGGLASTSDGLIPSISMRGCTLDGNHAPDVSLPPTGGGAYAAAGLLTVRSGIVASNAGGGLVCPNVSPGASIDSDYSDVWNNGAYDYYSCAPGPHSISDDPLFCGPSSDPNDPPWYCLFETSPANGTGWHGEDMGAGWVACYSVEDVVFYDNFSDQADDGWVVEEEQPEQVQVEEGEYSLNSISTAARSYVSALEIADLDLSVWFKPMETQLAGETRFCYRMDPVAAACYELSMRTEEQRGMLVRWEGGLGCIMAEFDCPVAVDAWQRLDVTASGARLTGVLEIPFGTIIPLFDLEDPVPLPAGTVGVGVAWRSAPAARGAQHTHFDRIMVRRAQDSSSTVDEDGSVSGLARPRVVAVPNPVRGAMTFRLLSTRATGLDLFDVKGRLVRTLHAVLPRQVAEGIRVLAWDGRDQAGRPVPSGVYSWRLRGSDGSDAAARGRLVMLR